MMKMKFRLMDKNYQEKKLDDRQFSEDDKESTISEKSNESLSIEDNYDLNEVIYIVLTVI